MAAPPGSLPGRAQVLERPAGAERDAGQRIVGDGDRKPGLVAKHLVEPLQQRAAAGQDDALVDDVGGELGRGILERDPDALDDRPDRLAQRLGDLALVDRDLLGHAVDEVAALDVDGEAVAVGGRLGDPDLLLDPLGGRLADQQIVVAADVGG
jgi:hypothetical protein